MFYSWYSTFPLSAFSANDFVFNHVSIFYWLSLPLLLVSMFLIALTTKNDYLKWILSIGIILTLFSLSYFYYLMPGPDSEYFRGASEHFINTRIMDSSHLNHFYYQWPAFFILMDIVPSVSGLSLANFEFLLFSIIGFLIATALYIYGSKKFKNSGVIVLIVFFMSINYFINYQSVPFTLALGLLFLMFVLDTHQKSAGLIVIMIILFLNLLILHLFVPLFFVFYLLLKSLLEKSSQGKRLYRNLSLITLVSYFLVELSIAQFSIDQIIKNIFDAPAEYSYIITGLTSAALTGFRGTAQFFSRTVTIVTLSICVIGLVLLFIKRQMTELDKSILVTGIVYSGLGFVLNTLGWRAIALALFPVSLGAAFLFRDKLKPYIAGLLIVLLALFVFAPINQSFNAEISFQTKENYIADNFFIEHYNWAEPGYVVTDFRTSTYLISKLSVNVFINDWLYPGERADAILYTPQFKGLKLANYSSMESLSQGEGLNVVYNNGISCLLTASH